MALSLTLLDADAAAMIADLPASIVWQGGTYACTAGSAENGYSLSEAGMVAEPSIQIVARTAVFTGARPQINDDIQYGGKTYRAVSVSTSQDDLTLDIRLAGRE